jgi:nitrite reductase (NO-forming)
VTRVAIAALRDDPRKLGRPLMADHHFSARVWAAAALVAALLPANLRLGWWLPLHLALAGAVSQLIVGGQLMFSATLGMARGPSRSTVLGQLALLNVGAAGVAAGRIVAEPWVLALGATSFIAGIAWSGVLVHRMWRASPNRKFAVTATSYRLAVVSILLGAGIGAALGTGAFNDASGYLSHRTIHMELNLFGWAGLTIVGTAVTLLPTVLHVRMAPIRPLRFVPWAMFGALLVIALGLSLAAPVVAAAGAVLLAGALMPVAATVRRVLATPRRRRIPVAGFHLLAALGWLGFAVVVQIPLLARGDLSALRDLWILAVAAGAIFQAVLGAWSFLLPMARPAVAELRRRELAAMEVAAPLQVLAYNLGLVIALSSSWGLLPASSGAFGLACVWSAAAWAVAKAWTFPIIARLPSVGRMAKRWWAVPQPSEER